MEAVSTDDVYDIVDQCLDEDDLVPLVRLVFDTPARGLQAVGPQLGDTQSLTTSIDAGESVTYREELLELVMDILQRTAKEAQGVMERISR
ncbi:hypothetical protein H632_c576p2 [Helicosporidium sp. ATCC 50920]|nr:hypothetical protein H632_c576p2 [Helicosporidium sp. ATCC 50920]|eukprot:KDD75641.1 hypothetical protein H632_c576p2 [Helicosporidium sp. ATCC 50920]